MEPEQNYKNHPQTNPAWIFGVLLPFFLNFVWASYRLIQSLTVEAVLNLAMAVAFLILWWFVRRMALTVQDRVIRLEMRLRLRDLLPSNMHSDIPRLTRSQLVALRFAGDDELAGLVREVLAGTLASQKDIKMKIRNWQADHLRA
jgi:uncharacterized membrane-anchored protein